VRFHKRITGNSDWRDPFGSIPQTENRVRHGFTVRFAVFVTLLYTAEIVTVLVAVTDDVVMVK